MSPKEILRGALRDAVRTVICNHVVEEYLANGGDAENPDLSALIARVKAIYDRA